MLAPSAFLASAAATSSLQLSILPMTQTFQDPHLVATLAVWSSRYTGPEPTGESCTAQKAWDKVAIDAGTRLLADSFSDEYNRARILACQAPHSGDWLHAIPITACGLRLDDEAIRVAIGLRLGIDLCAPHTCPCGHMVDARGAHGLSCRRSVGRITRHNLINDIVFRAFTRANIPASKEPHGLVRADGRRPGRCDTDPLEQRKVSHLGCHSPRHFGPIIPCHVIAVGRSSCGVCKCPQVGQVRVCSLHSYFLPCCMRDDGTDQFGRVGSDQRAGCTFECCYRRSERVFILTPENFNCYSA